MPKFVKLNNHTPENIKKCYEEITNANILEKIDPNPSLDPTKNLNIIENTISAAMEKYLPGRLVRFHKHKHKKSDWITNGIIRSIRFRDNLHKKCKTTPQDS